MAWPVAWSRLPVGSSANTMAGLALSTGELGGSRLGSTLQADQGEGVEGTGPSFALGDPGVEEAVGHVVEHALVFGQEELLEHEADPRRPQGGQFPVRQLGDVETGDPHTA
jgi:hypothetical protein